MTDPPRIDLQESLKAFCCNGCGFTLAQSQAARLLPSGSKVVVSCRGGERIRLTCPECGVSQLWQAMR